ncbi:MAG: ATP-grasp domain-containing protein [Lachnospiraceae bacterium]|nr:ATP-grasp domain-containing protein [Lachnospiraceae bacterium]
MTNSTTNFVKIIKEIAQEEGIRLTSYSYDWIFRLEKDQKSRYIIGYQFGLNAGSVQSLCSDKSAASDVMTSLGIPNVPHFYFMAPEEQHYIGERGNWSELLSLLSKYEDLVVKPNEGTGGDDVYRVRTPFELERAVSEIFRHSTDLAVSPYQPIAHEYRVIVLDGQIRLIFHKERAKDPQTGEYLTWKHNLGLGASAVIEEDPALKERLSSIVQMVYEKMDLRFASVDIVEVDGTYRVLEINSGVMMEFFSRQSAETYAMAKEIYRDAIRKMFA